jgi:transcriptional regulator with XRE-family HTH domain
MGNNAEHVEIGKILHKHRKSRGISQKEISDRTHILPETLEKLENGDFSEIPELYLKNFIRRYSTALGINNHSKINEFLKTGPKKDQIPVITKKQKNTPVNFILKTMIPVLVLILLTQLYTLNIQDKREKITITNRGQGEIIINNGFEDSTLKKDETIELKNNYTGHIFNKENSLIVVKYYDDTWEVFFEEFEVQLKNGKD